MKTHPSFLARSAAGLTLAIAAFTSLAAPAPVRDTVETIHGVTVHDPYRYFENVRDPEVRKWMKDQGAVARQALDRIPGREALERRISELSATSGDAIGEIVRMPGDKAFYLRRVKGERQFKLMLRESGKDRVLVDPQVDAARTGVPHAINYFTPSWDGRYVAYGLSQGGSEQASLSILDVKTGKAVGEPIPRVNEAAVSWLPDSRSFTYNQLRQLNAEDAESETYLDTRVMWLKVGAPASEARAVFGPTVTPSLGLARLDVGRIVFSPDSAWMIARTTDTTLPEGSLFLARVSDLGQGEVPWKRIASFDDRIVELELQRDTMFFRTHKDAPLYRVMKLDLRAPQLAKARDVALAPKGGVLEGFTVGRAGDVLVQVREGASIGLRRYAPGDTAGHRIAMPFKGAAGLHADPSRAYSDVLYTLSGWTQPPKVLRLRGERSSDAGYSNSTKPAGVPEVEVLDVQARSWDGAMVPMTILHRKGLKRDGSNPTLLIGYGSYGHSETAHFRASNYAWLEKGGVLAYANVRGSGVYGEPWRRAGFKATKSNTWKDAVACTEYLIAQGYASPKTMSILGGSAGGIFVGRAVTTAPQLYAAAIFSVGVMDAVRAEESANGITNISEFGSYRNAKEFPALLEMSTYHQIKDGTPYPAIMLVHGLNDPRVDVWHSAKAAARLQAASTSGKPILLRLDAQAGHGVGSTAAQRDAMQADVYAFLLWQMGKLGSH